MQRAHSMNDIRRVAVVGTGVIGAGWATRFLARGLEVVASDPAPGAEERLRASVARNWPAVLKAGLTIDPEPPEFGFSADLAAASAAPYVALFACSAASGVVADRLEARGLSPTRTRKLINSAGLLGGAAGFGALSCVAPCGGGSSAPRGSIVAATACLSVAIGMAGFGAFCGHL